MMWGKHRENGVWWSGRGRRTKFKRFMFRNHDSLYVAYPLSILGFRRVFYLRVMKPWGRGCECCGFRRLWAGFPNRNMASRSRNS